ncbi:MAG TPA: carboxypeptidase regulatory-like domain-containing protein [Kofleriaceae bacterium]|nr:carboxypeptidase regulatory-like domain-containing protein [Kofleriaceae bacterium]
MPSAKLYLALLLLAACGGSARPQPASPSAPVVTTAPPATAIKLPPPKPPQPELTGPVHERAKQLRRAGDLLDQAQQALDLGSRNNADILFSTAELLVGADAVAALAPRFREGAPPRVTSPIEKVALDQPAQPAAVGNSDEDEAAEAVEAKKPPKPPARGSLTGTLTIGGQPGGGGLALVTLEPKGRTWKARAPRQRVMEQRDRVFAPHLMIIPTGSTVTFPNFDTIFHNVFSTSQPGAFDLGLYRQGETRAVTFAKEGIVRLGCNIHSNMSATIVVIGAPHYVVPDGTGAFTFKSLAPGAYTLRAWSERTRAPLTQEITIRAGGNTVAVGVDGDAPPGVMDDKFGASRGN